jgi:hypothetical protein
MLVSREHCPADPIAVNINTAILYLRFHYIEKGEVLNHPVTNQPVTDIHGAEIHTRGDWQGTSVPGLFRSAMSKVHSHYEMTTGPYQEQCSDCRKIDIVDVCKGYGCQKHPGKPQYWRRGSVTKCKAFQDEITKAIEYCENHYESRSTYAFLPHQL